MGTMLITKSTPRITYKIGMRAGFGAVEDKSLPWFNSGAPSVGVAADFTGIPKSLMGKECPGAKTVRLVITKVPVKMGAWRGFGKTTCRNSNARSLLRSERLAFAAAGHQLTNCFTGSFTLVQDGVHLLGDWHLDAAGTGQSYRRRRREDALGNHAMHSGKDLRYLSAAAKFDSHTAIPRETARASQHQVAKAREARHSFGIAPTSHHQPRH